MSGVVGRKTAQAVEIVSDLARPFLREVLPQRSPERDIHNLRPTADPERGGSDALAALEEGEILLVAAACVRQVGDARARSVPGRRDVGATGDDEGVKVAWK